MRITLKDLESKIDYLNKITGNPVKTYLPNSNGGLDSQIGNYYLELAYGGHKLVQVVNQHGGITEPLNTGFTTKKELWYAIDNFMRGLEIRTEVQNG
jgi:hypothetical protein